MTRSVFENLSQRYDVLQKQALPNWQTFFSTVVEYIPEGKSNILELASGTGFLTSMIRKARPEASITCIDRDPAMLEVAKGKPELKDVIFIEGDILKAWPEGTFDLIVSTQFIFALPSDDRIRVFRQIHDSLRPDGIFIEGDIFRQESRLETMIYRSQWEKYMLEHDMSPAEVEEMLLSLDRIYGRIDTIPELKEKLKAAGFENVFCPYWYELYAVVVASV
ncbi:class I SAM-dependent methyltransferase [Methanococcoides sp. LMO-2]|uniref:Methyltransferase domain-containing protein n=1 Tax=Methanococcoides cohabitans TaxID=3136559 RepID=A0ABU9KT79_9EURY